MKKQQVDHVLRAAGRITGEKQFIIVGSQALHGRHLARRRLTSKDQLLALLKHTKLDDNLRQRIRARITADFAQPEG